MRTRYSKTATIVALTFLVMMGGARIAQAQWTALANAPPGFLDVCLLLTDGTVMCLEYGTNSWHRLKPDQFGSYQNGTWNAAGSTVANMPNGNDASFGCVNCTYAPLYFASAVLADGRVVVIGGEYISGFGAVWSNIGFMYDPVTNSWSSQLTEPFGGGCIGDASATVLADGRMLLADGIDCTTNGNLASFDPATLTFTALNPTGKADRNNEENWNLLPDGTFLTVDARIQSQSEIYDPVTNTWGNRTNTVVNMADTGTNTNSREVGPGVLRPDGMLIYFSGTSAGQNALYDTATGTWSNTAAMDFPLVPGQTYAYSVADGPASLLPNGNVLVQASPVTNVACGNPAPPPPPTCGVFNTPSHFYEFDFATNTLTAVADSPNAASFISYQGRMLLLPTGEVLLTAYDQNATQDVMLYSNGGAPQDAWRPTITSCLVEVTPGETYPISGTLFNGLSEGASYGDDAQMSTNYPLVRITNIATGHVFYARTHDHSRMGVQALGSTEIVTTWFDTPADMEAGPSELVVVVNGIASDPPIIVNEGAPRMQVPGAVSFDDTCVGDTSFETLFICNTGTANLRVDAIASSDPQFEVTEPSSGYQVVISPDFCFPFQVTFSPSSKGPKSTVFTIASNDACTPSLDVDAFGKGIEPNVSTIIADSGNFGDVCRDEFKDLTLIVSNSGGCDLTISNITSSSLDFQVPNVGSLVVGPGDSIKLPIRFAPPANAPFGAKNGTITVVSDDPDTPNKQVAVSGNVPPGDIRVTGSTDFGDVCAGAQAEKVVSVCNVGECNLNVSSVAFVGDCPDFTLVNNPFPAPVSPDSCEEVTIRFTPTSCGAKSCTLRINSDDPDTPVVDLTVTANTPCNDIDVSPDQCFSPTVIQSVGACNTLKSFPISNKGSCPIEIPSITLGGANSNAYFLSGLPSFPINLQPGHTVGDGDLDIGFAPISLARDTLANINVTYETDPITHATTVETRILNGEGVRTGARVLVTHNGVAVPLVEKLMIQRISGNRNKKILDTVDNAMNLPPITVTPAAPCGSFQYHREYSTVSNPIQLLPGSYQITATTIVGRKKLAKTIGFEVGTCGFNGNIVIELP